MAAMLLLLALATQTGPWSSVQPVTISRTEVRSIGREAAARLLFGDRGSVLLPMPPQPSAQPEPDRPLRYLTYFSPGRSTGRAGLCQADQVGVQFEPAGPNRGAATLIRPSRSWSGPFFYLARPRVAPTGAPLAEAARPGQEAACRAIDPRGTHLFFARDPDTVAQALPAMAQAVGKARARRRLPLDCTATGSTEAMPLNARRCRAFVARIDVTLAHMVSTCRSQAATRCFEAQLSFDPRSGPISWATFRIEDGGPGTVPARVAIIRMEPPLVSAPN